MCGRVREAVKHQYQRPVARFEIREPQSVRLDRTFSDFAMPARPRAGAPRSPGPGKGLAPFPPTGGARGAPHTPGRSAALRSDHPRRAPSAAPIAASLAIPSAAVTVSTMGGSSIAPSRPQDPPPRVPSRGPSRAVRLSAVTRLPAARDARPRFVHRGDARGHGSACSHGRRGHRQLRRRGRPRPLFDASATVARVVHGRRPTDAGRCLGLAFDCPSDGWKCALFRTLRGLPPPSRRAPRGSVCAPPERRWPLSIAASDRSP